VRAADEQVAGQSVSEGPVRRGWQGPAALASFAASIRPVPGSPGRSPPPPGGHAAPPGPRNRHRLGAGGAGGDPVLWVQCRERRTLVGERAPTAPGPRRRWWSSPSRSRLSLNPPGCGVG
jgi:hypothetical protein